MKAAPVLSLCFLFLLISSVRTQPSAVDSRTQYQKKMQTSAIQLNQTKLKSSQTRQLPSMSQQPTKGRGANPFQGLYQNKNLQNTRQQPKIQSNRTQMPLYVPNYPQTKRVGATQNKTQVQTNQMALQKQKSAYQFSPKQTTNQAQTRQTPTNFQMNSPRNQNVQVLKPQQLYKGPTNQIQTNQFFQNSQASRYPTSLYWQNQPQTPRFQTIQTSQYPPGPHPFKITPVYSSLIKRHPNFQLFRTFFEIGAAYFRRVLTVTPIPQSETRINQNNACYIRAVFPEIFYQYGFNQNETDTVVYVTITSGQFSASTQLCTEKFIRPVYSLLTYYSQTGIAEDPLNIRYSIEVTIHEMFHIFAFSKFAFNNFKINPNSLQTRPRDQIVKCDDINCYIITPKVMQYVRDYFNCHDGKTGAMLFSQYDQYHWNPRVFARDIMVPALGLSKNLITALNLALLEDSNFYYSVDYTYSEQATVGKNRGCGFAQGIRSQIDECKNFTCDSEHRSAQKCFQLYQNSTTLIYQGQNNGLICEDQLLENDDPYAFNYFGQSSRCFNTKRYGFAAPACFKAECVNGGIFVTIGQQTFLCNQPSKWLSIKNRIRLQCPENLQRFCAVNTGNPCESRGFYINGQCLYPE